MEEINKEEMFFEVVLSSATNSIEKPMEMAQKYMVEAFKEADSQDALSAIFGRGATGISYVMVTAGKITAQHGYDAIKIIIALKSGDSEKVMEEILSAAMGTLAAGAAASTVMQSPIPLRAA